MTVEILKEEYEIDEKLLNEYKNISGDSLSNIDLETFYYEACDENCITKKMIEDFIEKEIRDYIRMYKCIPKVVKKFETGDVK